MIKIRKYFFNIVIQCLIKISKQVGMATSLAYTQAITHISFELTWKCTKFCIIVASFEDITATIILGGILSMAFALRITFLCKVPNHYLMQLNSDSKCLRINFHSTYNNYPLSSIFNLFLISNLFLYFFDL